MYAEKDEDSWKDGRRLKTKFFKDSLQNKLYESINPTYG